MSFVIFDEATYLAAYPDVRAAVAGGAFASGLQHFQQFGLAEGRTRVSPLYDEPFYLRNHPDVAAAVSAGVLRSGLAHFIQYGEAEGRRPSQLFDEGLYIRRHSDLEAAKNAGLISTGLQHYVLFGRAEGRSGAELSEPFYRFRNPDVAAAVDAGVFLSGYDHYEQYGQVEGRTAPLYGTDGNDTIAGFGQNTEIAGVDFALARDSVGRILVSPLSRGEVDVLIGGGGVGSFRLGHVQSVSVLNVETPFYAERGEEDLALIRSFERFRDEIFLAGRVSDYAIAPIPGSVRISRAGDVVAVVEGATALSVKAEFTGFTHSFTLT